MPIRGDEDIKTEAWLRGDVRQAQLIPVIPSTSFHRMDYIIDKFSQHVTLCQEYSYGMGAVYAVHH